MVGRVGHTLPPSATKTVPSGAHSIAVGKDSPAITTSTR